SWILNHRTVIRGTAGRAKEDRTVSCVCGHKQKPAAAFLCSIQRPHRCSISLKRCALSCHHTAPDSSSYKLLGLSLLVSLHHQLVSLSLIQPASVSSMDKQFFRLFIPLALN
ncbi:mCG1027486, isoform CRA_a, partial [Mus musculus]